jgi:hypothetical protein
MSSFGYSFGDFIAGANLSYRLTRALSGTRGANIEYQEAINELASIQQTFYQIGRLKESNILPQSTIDAASYIVLSSVDLIGDFLERTKRYRKRFCERGGASKVSDSWMKIGWVLFESEELRELKVALHLKMTSIGILLSTAQLYVMPS